MVSNDSRSAELILLLESGTTLLKNRCKLLSLIIKYHKWIFNNLSYQMIEIWIIFMIKIDNKIPQCFSGTNQNIYRYMIYLSGSLM